MDPDWVAIVANLEAKFPTDAAMTEELARRQGDDDAFPEDMAERGRRIFAATSAMLGAALCGDPRIVALLNDSGPRTSEVLTIVPLLASLLPAGSFDDVSIALLALLIVRMGLGAFCRSHARKAP